MAGDNGIAAPNDKEFRLFQRMLQDRPGIFLPDQKKSLVSHRLWKRLQARQLSCFSDYYRLINQPDEQVNLNRPLPELGRFDLVFLRNVMIYFDEATKRDVLDRMMRVLQPDGWLFVGHWESLQGIDSEFRALAPAVYQLQGGRRGQH